MATKKISYTYWFTGIITITSTACSLYLIVSSIILFASGREQNQMTMSWLNIEGWIFCGFAIILVVYLLFAFFGLRMKMHEIFGK
jgi:hypothetical protein